jgi:hypothetical protein
MPRVRADLCRETGGKSHSRRRARPEAVDGRSVTGGALVQPCCVHEMEVSMRTVFLAGEGGGIV